MVDKVAGLIPSDLLVSGGEVIRLKADESAFETFTPQSLAIPITAANGGTGIANGASCTLTLPNTGTEITGGGTLALGTYTLTVPATGTTALLGTNQTYTSTRKINVNSTTALFVEQDGVKDNVLIVDTTNGRVGVNMAPTIAGLDVTGDIYTSIDVRVGGGLYVGSTATDPAVDTITADGNITSYTNILAKNSGGAGIGIDPGVYTGNFNFNINLSANLTAAHTVTFPNADCVVPATGGTFAMGSAACTVSTTSTTATAHTHAITSSADPGAVASLLSCTAAGLLTLQNLYTDVDARIGGGLYVGSIATDPATDTIMADDYIIAMGGLYAGANIDPTTGYIYATAGILSKNQAANGTGIGLYNNGSTGDIARNCYFVPAEGITGSRQWTMPDQSGYVPLAAGTCTITSTNNYLTTNAHTHAISTDSSPAATAAILATDAGGLVTIQGLGIGLGTAAAYNIHQKAYDAVTNTAFDCLVLSHNTTAFATMAAEFGCNLRFQAEGKSGTDDLNQFLIRSTWLDPVEASRTSQVYMFLYSGAAGQQILKGIGDAGGVKMSFFDETTCVVRATHIADATGAADVITRCNAILVVLENLGFVKKA